MTLGEGQPRTPEEILADMKVEEKFHLGSIYQIDIDKNKALALQIISDIERLTGHELPEKAKTEIHERVELNLYK